MNVKVSTRLSQSGGALLFIWISTFGQIWLSERLFRFPHETEHLFLFWFFGHGFALICWHVHDLIGLFFIYSWWDPYYSSLLFAGIVKHPGYLKVDLRWLKSLTCFSYIHDGALLFFRYSLHGSWSTSMGSLLYRYSGLVVVSRDSVLNGSLTWSLFYQVCSPWWLRHGAMDPIEGTHLGECWLTRLRTWHFHNSNSFK